MAEKRGTLSALSVVLLVWAAPVMAQQSTPDLGKATLEELMNVRIVSASRKDQRMVDTAAAVYVITQDDIRRSGFTTVPDLLRLAPGVEVARIDANKWAVAVRGFNSRWSNKLLVLVDGRTIYNRLLSGVYWDMVNIPLQNIERIEVVRGPGGSVWGANAVDGVINILTKSAAATTGGFLSLGAGRFGAADAAASYGVSAGRLAYRVDASGLDMGDGRLPVSGLHGGDDASRLGGGFRMDWTGIRTDVTIEAGTSNGRSGTRAIAFFSPFAPAGGWQTTDQMTTFADNDVRMQFTRRAGARSSLRAEAFVEHVDRQDIQSHYATSTVDTNLAYQTTVGVHELVLGAAYRHTGDRFDGNFGMHLTQPGEDLAVFNLFAQDEAVWLGGRMHLTVGSKFEHDTVSHWALQPTARMLFAVSPRQRVWTAVSRALRTPSRVDRTVSAVAAGFTDASSGLPVVVEFDGTPAFRSEELQSIEAGYRASAGHTLTFDAAAFVSRYQHLVTVETLAPVLQSEAGQPYLVVPQVFGNNQNARTRGLEGTVRWQPRAAWQIEAGVSTFHITPHPGVTTDPAAAIADGDVPRWQWQLRAGYTHGRVDLGGAVFGVGAIRTRAIPAYTRADAHVEWRMGHGLVAGVTLQNLAGAGHMEFGGPDNFATPTVSPRTVLAHFSWRF